jgi:hypothetical protein
VDHPLLALSPYYLYLLLKAGLNIKMPTVQLKVINELLTRYIGGITGRKWQIWQCRMLLDGVQVQAVVVVMPRMAYLVAFFE